MRGKPVSYIYGFIGSQRRLLGLVYADQSTSKETAERVTRLKKEGYARVHVSPVAVTGR